MISSQEADMIEEARIEIALTLSRLHNEWGIEVIDLMPIALAEISLAIVDALGKEIAAEILRHALERVGGG